MLFLAVKAVNTRARRYQKRVWREREWPATGGRKTLAACQACAPAAKYDTSLMVSGDNQVRPAEKLTDVIPAYLCSDKPDSESEDCDL